MNSHNVQFRLCEYSDLAHRLIHICICNCCQIYHTCRLSITRCTVTTVHGRPPCTINVYMRKSSSFRVRWEITWSALGLSIQNKQLISREKIHLHETEATPGYGRRTRVYASTIEPHHDGTSVCVAYECLSKILCLCLIRGVTIANCVINHIMPRCTNCVSGKLVAGCTGPIESWLGRGGRMMGPLWRIGVFIRSHWFHMLLPLVRIVVSPRPRGHMCTRFSQIQLLFFEGIQLDVLWFTIKWSNRNKQDAVSGVEWWFSRQFFFHSPEMKSNLLSIRRYM